MPWAILPKTKRSFHKQILHAKIYNFCVTYKYVTYNFVSYYFCLLLTDYRSPIHRLLLIHRFLRRMLFFVSPIQFVFLPNGLLLTAYWLPTSDYHSPFISSPIHPIPVSPIHFTYCLMLTFSCLRFSLSPFQIIVYVSWSLFPNYC